jgi:hypothetical protein
MRVHIGLFTSVARVEVWDRGDGNPRPVPGGGTDEGGRGLLLVEALAAEWGWSVRRGRFGKAVWAELKLPHEPVSPYGMRLPVLPSVDDGRDLAVLRRVRDGLKRLSPVADRHRSGERTEPPEPPGSCSGWNSVRNDRVSS